MRYSEHADDMVVSTEKTVGSMAKAAMNAISHLYLSMIDVAFFIMVPVEVLRAMW